MTAHGQAQALAGLDADAILESDLAGWDYGDGEGLRSADIEALRPGWNLWRDGLPAVRDAWRCGRTRRSAAGAAGLPARSGGTVLARPVRVAIAARWMGGLCWPGSTLKLHPASLGMLGYAAHPPQTRLVGLWTEVPMVPARG